MLTYSFMILPQANFEVSTYYRYYRFDGTRRGHYNIMVGVSDSNKIVLKPCLCTKKREIIYYCSELTLYQFLVKTLLNNELCWSDNRASLYTVHQEHDIHMENFDVQFTHLLFKLPALFVNSVYREQ